MHDTDETRLWLGSALVAGSAIAYSTAGYFTRLVDLDVPTLLFWRGLYGGIFMSLCIVVIYGRKTFDTILAIGPLGLAAAVLSAIATVCYLNALRLTTVAEVMAINATSPFISGALAWLILGEKESWRIIAASFVALLGIGIMVGPGAISGQVAGALLAFAMTFSLVLMILIMRAKKSVSLLPASCLSAFLSSIFVLPFGDIAVPECEPMMQLALFGIVQFGLGLIMLTQGARLVSALRTSLLSRLQTVLGPIWVWLAFAEVPPATTIVGATLIVFTTVFAALASNTK